MRIFYAFIIIITAAIMWMIPITESVYQWRTDVRTDNFNVDTAVAATTSNVTLHGTLYDSDTNTVSFLSDTVTDVPAATSYNATSRQLLVTGLTHNSTRSLEVSYDIDALLAWPGVDVLADRIGFIWMLCIIAFPMAALFAIFTGR